MSTFITFMWLPAAAFYSHEYYYLIGRCSSTCFIKIISGYSMCLRTCWLWLHIAEDCSKIKYCNIERSVYVNEFTWLTFNCGIMVVEEILVRPLPQRARIVESSWFIVHCRPLRVDSFHTYTSICMFIIVIIPIIVATVTMPR